MKLKDLFLDMLVIGIIAFIVGFIVIYLWNLIFHGQGVMAFGYAARLALIIGISVPLGKAVGKKK